MNVVVGSVESRKLAAARRQVERAGVGAAWKPA
jgi:hypothetical protein